METYVDVWNKPERRIDRDEEKETKGIGQILLHHSVLATRGSVHGEMMTGGI